MYLILRYTDGHANHHGYGGIAASRRIGRQRGAHDLIIAAHAAETGRIIFSRDAKARFADLPGVLAMEP